MVLTVADYESLDLLCVPLSYLVCFFQLVWQRVRPGHMFPMQFKYLQQSDWTNICRSLFEVWRRHLQWFDWAIDLSAVQCGDIQ